MSGGLLSECDKVPWHEPWRGDDFDPCFRALVINRSIPAAAAVASAELLLATLLGWWWRGSPAPIAKTAPSERSPARYGAIDSHLPATASSAQRLTGHYANSMPPPPPPPPERPWQMSIRDKAMAVLLAVQIALAFGVLSGDLPGEITAQEMALWLWAAILCLYGLLRTSA
ncbi:hypothetical protein H4R19_007087, partial [Coemansia spiralis]